MWQHDGDFFQNMRQMRLWGLYILLYKAKMEGVFPCIIWNIRRLTDARRSVLCDRQKNTLMA